MDISWISEALFSWILLFGIACFVYYPMPVSAYFERSGDYFLDEEDKIDEFIPVKLRDYNPSDMTCNCSWGTVLYRTHTQRKANNEHFGGKLVDAKEHYPMIGGLQTEQAMCMVCAATILTHYHALTTAQCLRDHSKLTLAVGVKNRCRQSNGGGQYIPLLKTNYIHEDYNPATKENDIAIVVTSRKIVFTNNVGPTCVHTEQICNEKDPILVLGWGKLSSHDGASPMLLKMFVQAVEPQSCKKRLGGNIIPNQYLRLCTVAFKMVGCAGDSGSPLFMVDHSVNRIAQIGMMTSGTHCGRTDVPATSVSLHPYLGWIQWTVEKSMKEHYPLDYTRCDSSFCYITTPKVS